MRTTVNIDDALLQQARQRALASSRPLGDIVDDALRLLLVGRGATPAPLDLPTYGGSGLQPGVDLEDKQSIVSLVEDDLDRAH